MNSPIAAENGWEQLDATINIWLIERQELIVLYCALCGFNELADSPEEEKVLAKLKLFCEILIDYLSAGHFEIFSHILEEAESKADASVVSNIYPKIESNTQTLLDFNDTYDTPEQSRQALSQLPEKLSQLGEALSNRFDLEDEFIRLHRLVN